MYKEILKKGLLMSGLFSEFSSNRDDFEKYKEAQGLFIENDWERVKNIFSKDDFGNYHPELNNAIIMTQLGGLVGGIIGGLLSSHERTKDFIDNNDCNIFQGKNEALRKLSYQSILGFSKGAFKMAPKFAIFFGGFSLFASCCEAYRNKSGIIEYTVAGGGIGALLRFNYGFRGCLSGSIIGGALGTFYGIFTVAVLKLFSVDKIELKYTQFALSKYREEKLAKMRRSENDDVGTPEVSHLIEHIENPLNTLDNTASFHDLVEDDIKEKKDKK